jgi:hypothetical protein
MKSESLIFSELLCLRQRKASDIPSFYKLCADPESSLSRHTLYKIERDD